MSSHPFGYESWADFFREMEGLPSLEESDDGGEDEDGYWLSQDEENDLVVIVYPKTAQKRTFPKTRFLELYQEMRAATAKSRCRKCGGEIGFYVDIDSTNLINLRCCRCNAGYKLLDGCLHLYV